jgi:hypothetical protein
MFRWKLGREGQTRHLSKYNYLGSFLLLNPDFFFCVSGPAKKVVLALFFGVAFMAFSQEDFSGGVFGS